MPQGSSVHNRRAEEKKDNANPPHLTNYAIRNQRNQRIQQMANDAQLTCHPARGGPDFCIPTFEASMFLVH